MQMGEIAIAVMLSMNARAAACHFEVADRGLGIEYHVEATRTPKATGEFRLETIGGTEEALVETAGIERRLSSDREIAAMQLATEARRMP